MSRLTQTNYLRNHELLRADRAANRQAFVFLSASEQWDLFAYYLPHELREAAALLAHRQEISRLDPSLPQRAGRAFHHWRRIEAALPAYKAWVTKQPHLTSQKDRRVKVFGEVNPELDPKKFAEIIIELAKLGPPPNLSEDGPKNPDFEGR